MKIYFVYVTVRDAAEARRIGRALVKSRLAACVNVWPRIDSIYRWDGKIQRGREAALAAKTTRTLVRPLIDKIKTLHRYSCPCIEAWPIETGNPEFLAWVKKETGPQTPWAGGRGKRKRA